MKLRSTMRAAAAGAALALLGAVALAPAEGAALASAGADATNAPRAGPAAQQRATQAEALHVLDRLGYGPAPGDVAHVMQIGVDRYIDEQLHPERIALPPALEQQLAALGTTQLSQRQLIVGLREAQRAARTDGEQGREQRREWVRQVDEQAAQARLLRATRSPRQLEEVMVDSWFNHFNVFVGKGLDRVLVANYEREAIRPHALGHFRDLLAATAHHPAMLFYLDNWLSVAPGYRPPRGGVAARSGLNENYAREIMELHTLGVDGGYTQKDVTELARMLTGWTIDPRRGSGASTFHFDARRHDDGDKLWRGHSVAARGQAEGEWALGVLAADPATARHISGELAQYFVADQPPPALVERMTRTYLASDGDIRAVLATLFASPEFRAPAARGAKFKTPYQYVVSALRAADLPMDDMGNVRPLLATLNQLGMPLFGCQTPDGYKNTEQAWLNPDAVTRRVTFATALATGRLPLVHAKGADRSGAAEEVSALTAPLAADALLDTLAGGISAATRRTIAQAPERLQAAMVLGSPDFMRR